MADDVELVIAGQRHAGFESGSVTQVFEAQLSAISWSVEYSTRADEHTDPVIIEEGDEATIRVGDEDLVRGYVTQPRERYDATRRSHSVAGASRIIDLIECSAVASSRRFRDQTLFQIAMALCADYDVVIDDRAVDNVPIPHFALQEGETIAEALGRAARLRALVLTDMAGALAITHVGAERTATRIERGRNVLSGERVGSGSQRFSEYRFRGQTRATDEQNGLSAAQLGQRIEDRGVRRTRRLVVYAHGHSREDMGRRAIIERNSRAGRAERLVYEVSGWHCDEGLWRPNVRVAVQDDWLRVDAELLITKVTHAFDMSRWRTTLELARPEAFSDLSYPERARGASWR